MPVPTQSRSPSPGEDLDDEICLLDAVDAYVEDTDSGLHELRTAPVFTRGAYRKTSLEEEVNQYGVLGRMVDEATEGSAGDDDPNRLYLNTNAPLSAVVCGLQGSGKSHTVAVMLENMFISDYTPTGLLVKPLSGLILHFGETGSSSRPCEAAYLGVSQVYGVHPPPIRVYVSPGSIKRMTKIYAPLGANVQVERLYFSESELDASAFLSMMAVGSSESAPLYIQGVMNILRKLGEDYTYAAFMSGLAELKKTLNPVQLGSLEQRMELLNGFTKSRSTSSKATTGSQGRFREGQITIIDLSDPFINPSSACAIFEIVLRLFERAEVDTGKVLVVDEAHKYLSQTNTSTGLTKALLSVIRQQRHLSMRVIVSTQEPTIIPPVFIDLCSVVILHRFSARAWWEHLSKHVAADLSNESTFDKVVKLKTGEAILLAPAGLCLRPNARTTADDGDEVGALSHFGRRFFVIKTRRRVTADGGASLLAVELSLGS